MVPEDLRGLISVVVPAHCDETDIPKGFEKGIDIGSQCWSHFSMPSAKKPLPHQVLAISNIHQWLEEPETNAFLEMPTGSGKTSTAVWSIAEKIKQQGSRVLWIAHNAYLLNQAKKAFEKALGPIAASSFGEISGGKKQFDREVTFAMVQTLAANDLQSLKTLCAENRPDFVVYDEFHHAAADKWKLVVQSLTKSRIRILGLSATPTRSDEKQKAWLKKYFPQCVFRIGINELIDAEILARPLVNRKAISSSVEWDKQDIAHLKRFADVPQAVLNRLAKEEKRNVAILSTYKKFKQSNKFKKTIVFCCSILHAEALAKRFDSNGVRAVAVVGSAKDENNVETLEEFQDENSSLDVLTSVTLLTEGVDLPVCDSVFLARPTQSEILVKQMIGRAMRGPKVGGNKECTVVDFVDAFSNVSDVSSTSLSFVREHDEAIRKTLTRKPTRNDRSSLDLAVLLRLRDWFARNFSKLNESGEGHQIRERFREEIGSVLEFFDNGSSIARAVLIPYSERDQFEDAVKRVKEDEERGIFEGKSTVEISARISMIFWECFADDTMVGEEDFVAAITAVLKEPERKDIKFKSANDAYVDLCKSKVIKNKTFAGSVGNMGNFLEDFKRSGIFGGEEE